MDSLLLIDDDVELCAMLVEYLQAEGFAVEAVHRGDTGLEQALVSPVSLIVLDLMLPGLGGLDLLRRLRQRSQLPVLLLTARGSEIDRIVGLEIGADDYLPKPFNPRELIARIRAILRRPVPHANSGLPGIATITIGDISLDPASRVVLRDRAPIHLTSVEFDVLHALLQSAGSIVTRDRLVTQVLGRDFSPFDRSIDVHIANLRKKLGPSPAAPAHPAPHPSGERIKSIRSCGYLYARPPGQYGRT